MGISNHLYIITGSTRGLGQHFIEQLLQPNHAVICIAPSHDPSLKLRAQAQGAQLVQWQQDLGDSLQASRRLADWLSLQSSERFKQAHLIHINDAWTRPCAMRDMGLADIAQLMRSNLETPMSLTAAFLRGSREWPQVRKVLLISPLLQTQHAPYRAAQMALNEFVELCSADESRFPVPTQLSCLNIAPSSSDHPNALATLTARAIACLQADDFGHEPSLSWSVDSTTA